MTTPTPSATVQPSSSPTATPTAAVHRLVLSDLENAHYPEIGTTTAQTAAGATLVNGSYATGTGLNVDDVTLNRQSVSFGDLNGDGLADAFVLLYQNDGGSGGFPAGYVVLNVNGEPVAHLADAIKLTDREEVESSSISNGVLTLNELVDGPNDPLADPTVKQTQQFKLQGTELVQVGS